MVKVLWTQKQDVGPSARGEHAVAFDAARQRVVLFGGRAGGGTPQGDTWAWAGEDWTQVADTGPDARSGHALTFDANRQRAVLFGGEAGSGLRADTWEWDGAHWTQAADTGPGPAHASAMTFVGGPTLLFGGVTDSPGPIVEALSRLSWEWDGAQWTLRQDMGPTPRWGHALAFDSARGRAVLFAGFSALPTDPAVADSVLADTWEAVLEEIPIEVPEGDLVSFTLTPDTVTSSTVEPPSVVLEVGLDGPAPPGGAHVQVDVFDLQSGLPTAFGPGFALLLGEGETTKSTTLPVLLTTAVAVDFLFEARLGDVTLTAVLHLLP
jgi:hypothetical protein